VAVCNARNEKKKGDGMTGGGKKGGRDSDVVGRSRRRRGWESVFSRRL